MVDKRQLESQGYGLGATWGGPRKAKYYAPDGSMIEAIPGHLTDGHGTIIDRYLLLGYTLTPPEHPKPHCAGCNKWHDTEAEVKACIKRSKARAKKWDDWAKAKRNREGSKETDELKKEVTELKESIKRTEAMMKQLLGKKEERK